MRLNLKLLAELHALKKTTGIGPAFEYKWKQAKLSDGSQGKVNPVYYPPPQGRYEMDCAVRSSLCAMSPWDDINNGSFARWEGRMQQVVKELQGVDVDKWGSIEQAIGPAIPAVTQNRADWWLLYGAQDQRGLSKEEQYERKRLALRDMVAWILAGGVVVTGHKVTRSWTREVDNTVQFTGTIHAAGHACAWHGYNPQGAVLRPITNWFRKVRVPALLGYNPASVGSGGWWNADAYVPLSQFTHGLEVAVGIYQNNRR
jgi:hypothetical protein